MFKNFKSAVVAPALVLTTANAAMALNEYHLKCESESGPTMRASASPWMSQNRELTMCGYTMWIDAGAGNRIVSCLNRGEDIITYSHSNYSNRLCTVRG